MTLVTPPAPPRSPWQRLYAAAHARRRRRAARHAARLPRPVVSVGNLHWGGTGKTPVVAALAAHLRDAGRRVAILSRGYRGSAREPLLVSRGDGPLAGPDVAGDEPAELAARLPGVAIAVGRSRHAAGELALATLAPPPDLFLLDDGFSHVALARDLDLLVLPAADPFGGGRLPPGGRLREPLASSRHAHALLLTGADATPEQAAAIGAALAASGFSGAAFAAPTVAAPAHAVAGEPLAPGSPVLLVAGIANPARFLAAARAQELAIHGTLLFGDHHRYRPGDLRHLERAFAASGARHLLTTGKDLVKLQPLTRLPLALLPVAAAPEPAFWPWLADRLAALSR